MPQVVLVAGVGELDHANDRLHVVGYAGAGYDPPSNDAENPDAVRREAFVFFRCDDVGEVVLALSTSY